MNQHIPEKTKQHASEIIQLLNNSSQPQSCLFQMIITKEEHQAAMIAFDNLDVLLMKSIAEKSVNLMLSQPIGYQRNMQQYFPHIVHLYSRTIVKKLLITNSLQKITNTDLNNANHSLLSSTYLLLATSLISFIINLLLIIYFSLISPYLFNHTSQLSHIHQQLLINTTYHSYNEQLALWLIRCGRGRLQPEILQQLVLQFQWLQSIYKFACIYSSIILPVVCAVISYLFFEKIRRQNRFQRNLAKYKGIIQMYGGPLKIID